MSSPTPPSSDAPRDGRGARRGSLGEATAWLLETPGSPDLPAFLPEVQARAALEIWTRGGADLQALEARCVAGDSAAARALAMVHVAAIGLGQSVARSPRASLRERLVASAAAIDAGPRASEAKRVEVVAPVIAVAEHHPARPEERAREAALAAVGADVRDGDAPLRQVLDRVASLVDFPLLVVSIVTGGETVHRAFRCTLPGVDGPPRVVPRAASFCTHCVADGSPLVIPDASSDPFFARHPAVSAFHLLAYFGVPLRLASGAIAGTLCAYDVRPREISIEDVALLEIFSRRVIAHLEGTASGPSAADILDAQSSGAGCDVYAAPLFEDLLQIERLRVAAGRPSALLVAGPLATIPPGDGDALAGRLADGRAAWLLSGQHAARARVVADTLQAATGAPIGVASLAAGEDPGTVARWVDRAVAR